MHIRAGTVCVQTVKVQGTQLGFRVWWTQLHAEYIVYRKMQVMLNQSSREQASETFLCTPLATYDEVSTTCRLVSYSHYGAANGGLASRFPVSYSNNREKELCIFIYNFSKDKEDNDNNSL